MKIDLWYDPVQPETTVFLNGEPIDRHDIYGFLYPVRRYLLQSWLKASGSWPGLLEQLRGMARQEPLSVCFHGRRQDFEDLENALTPAAGSKETAVTFQPWEAAPLWEEQLREAEAGIQKMIAAEAGGEAVLTPEELFPDEIGTIRQTLAHPIAPWLSEVYDEPSYRNARALGGTCCYVHPEFLDSYEKLDRLQELTRSMLRTEEMIVCAVPDDRRREDLSRYAGQFSAMNFVFAADTVAPLAELELKFSRPLQLRGRLSRCRLAAAALDRLYNKETAIREENKRLCELEKKQELNARGMREKIRCGEKLYWLNKKRIPLQQVHELLAAASIPSDGGTQT